MEHFFSPILGEDQKKKGLQQEKNTFFPKFTLSCTPFQIIGGDAEVNHSQTIGGVQPNYRGGYIPSIPLPPRVSAPLIEFLLLARQHIFHSHNVVKKTTTLFCCKQCRRQSNRSEGALAESEGVLAESEGVLKSTELLHIKTDILRLQILTILLSWLKNRRIRPAVFLTLFRIRPI